MKQTDLSKATQNLSVKKYCGNQPADENISVVVEKPIQLMVNETLIATVMCTPVNLEELLIGFLFGQGIVEDINQIQRTLIDDEKGLLWAQVKDLKSINLAKTLITSGCTGGVAFDNFQDLKALNSSQNQINCENINLLMNKMLSKAEIYKKSGGIHCAGLADKNELFFVSEDIGRHNAIDKVIGFMVNEKIDSKDKIILTSGRLSLEAIIKAARVNINLLATRSTPTSLAIKVGQELNIGIIGYVRAKQMIVY